MIMLPVPMFISLGDTIVELVIMQIGMVSPNAAYPLPLPIKAEECRNLQPAATTVTTSAANTVHSLERYKMPLVIKDVRIIVRKLLNRNAVKPERRSMYFMSMLRMKGTASVGGALGASVPEVSHVFLERLSQPLLAALDIIKLAVNDTRLRGDFAFCVPRTIAARSVPIIHNRSLRGVLILARLVDFKQFGKVLFHFASGNRLHEILVGQKTE